MSKQIPENIDKIPGIMSFVENKYPPNGINEKHAANIGI